MKRIITAIQPSNQLTIGNYLGALKQVLELAKDQDTEIFLFVADLHVLSSSNYNKTTLRKNIIDVLKLYYAVGLDFNKHHIFTQSGVPAHTMLANVLLNFTTLGQLDTMTQFKDKVAKLQNQANHTFSINSGLLFYPVLMAADILLYDAYFVPIGKDQTQHLELTAKLAKKLNKIFNSNLFIVPKPIISTQTAKIKDLITPTIKMSKSNAPAGTIFITDSEQTIKEKIARATTDSYSNIAFNEETQPGISNLLTIASALSNKPIAQIIAENSHNDYKLFKDYVSNIIISNLKILQEKMANINEKEMLKQVTRNNAFCNEIATKKMQEVYEKLGFLQLAKEN